MKVRKERYIFKSEYALYEGRELTLNAFKSWIFPKNAAKVDWIKILTLKQMLPRLPIAPAQVKAANTSECLLNEIRQIIYSLYLAKEITKTLHSNIMNSVNV